MEFLRTPALPQESPRRERPPHPWPWQAKRNFWVVSPKPGHRPEQEHGGDIFHFLLGLVTWPVETPPRGLTCLQVAAAQVRAGHVAHSH